MFQMRTKLLYVTSKHDKDFKKALDSRTCKFQAFYLLSFFFFIFVLIQVTSGAYKYTYKSMHLFLLVLIC